MIINGKPMVFGKIHMFIMWNSRNIFFVSDDDHFLSQMNPADLHGEGTMG
jgi:hypothetical protein